MAVSGSGCRKVLLFLADPEAFHFTGAGVAFLLDEGPAFAGRVGGEPGEAFLVADDGIAGLEDDGGAEAAEGGGVGGEDTVADVALRGGVVDFHDGRMEGGGGFGEEQKERVEGGSMRDDG